MANNDIDKIVGVARDRYLAQKEREKQQREQKSQNPASDIDKIAAEAYRKSMAKRQQQANPMQGPRREETPLRMARQKSVFDWAERYDKATRGFFDYDKKRNGRYTADAEVR